MAKTFAALNHPNYRKWFIGYSISLVGSWMQMMAQQVLVYRLSGSASALGLVNFMSLIPLIPFSLIGGILCDRYPKRNVLYVTQILTMSYAIILGVLTATNTVELWHIYGLAILLGAVQAVDMPARQSFIVELIDDKKDLTNAVALNSAIFNGARIVGPAIAGILVAAIGEAPAFFVNAASFLTTLIALFSMKNLPPVPQNNTRGESYLSNMVVGYNHIRQSHELKIILSLVAISAFLSMPYNTLMPVFANKVLLNSATPIINAICSGDGFSLHCLNPEALPLGLLLAAVGVGAVTGALIVASLPNSAPRGVMLTIGNLIFPLALLLFSASRDFVTSLLVMLMVGIGFTWQNSLANTLFQLRSPDQLRGRIMSFYTLAMQGFMRLGGLQAGSMADFLGAPLTVGLGAGISLLYGLYVAVRYPAIRKMK